MKRRGACSRGGRKRNKHTTRTIKKKQKTSPPPPPPIFGTVATRTRRQQKTKASTWNQPVSILITILSYADPETIRQACCVSKQFCDLVYNNPGMAKNRVVPLLEIRPSSEDTGDEDEDRLGRLAQQLYHLQDKLQRYGTLTMIDPDKFMCSNLRTMGTMTEQIRLNGIVSFEMAGECYNKDTTRILQYFFSKILLNLHEVNLSNTGFRYDALKSFSTRCNHLEKVTWNNANRSSLVSVDGADIQKATNLREIYMDESSFFTRAGKTLSDLVNRSDIFLFYECESKILERVSIRNAKWCDYGRTEDRYPITIPQSALIKFVRKAPKSLRWFRSNLTTENMTMLRSERPEIELVN